MGNKKNIFISYRRADSQDFAGRLHDSLCDTFEVFFDTEGGIAYGEVFPVALENGIKKADVVLMVIGNRCCEEFKAKEGQTDFVIEEITLAHKLGKHILPILMQDVEAFPNCFPDALAFVKTLNAYLFGRGEFSMYIKNLSNKIHTLTAQAKPSDAFRQEVLELLERTRLVVLFSQDFCEINQTFIALKELLSTRFSSHCLMVSVPSFVDDELDYFGSIATECGFDATVKSLNDWNKAMRQRLKESHKPLLLFLTDLEDGNQGLDRKLATLLRNLHRDFEQLHVLLVGRKSLARLVHQEGDLSPLNTAKEIFFPQQGYKLEEQTIVQAVQGFKKHKKRLCNYLKREQLGRFSTWSYNELLNQLFWKNLLIHQNGYYVWRGEQTKSLVKELLECDE